MIVHDPAVFLSPKDYGIETVLAFKALQGSVGDGLDDGNAAVKISFFVQNVDHMIGEGAQKIAFPELDHAHRA